MTRKYPSLSPTKLYATHGPKRWVELLTNCIRTNSAAKLVAWRYGLQAGLADENSNGKRTSEAIDLWTVGRLKDIENAMKHILRKRYPNPLDVPNAKLDDDTFSKAHDAKRKRDREFQTFLMKSNF